MNVGDILNFDYTGAVQTQSLPPGKYQLEVWGAQGGNGNNSTTYAGGKGGYAKGTLTLNETTTLNIYVGGQGAGKAGTGVQAGGWNGGGAGGYYRGGSGGGATDIRKGGTALSNRIIVAGGGGGGAYRSGYYGGVGGGSSGGAGTGYSTTYNAKGGTQSAGGAGGSYNGGNYKGGDGTSGTGGAAATSTTSNYGRSGGGGGGYYGGGGGGYRASSSYYYYGQSGGGGGSGYVDSTLTDTQNSAGSASFPATGGGTETGHAGNGYARITVLELVTVPDTPSNLRKSSATYYAVTLAWNSVSGATGYKIYKDNTLVKTQTGTSYTASGMTPGESHTYKVTAYNTAGESDPASLTASTNSITKPGSLQQTTKTYNSIGLSWTTSGTVDGYHVYKGGTLVATTTALSYSESGLSPQTNYSYSVKAYVGSYESAAATITAGTKSVPTPTNFTVTGKDYTALTLSWDLSDAEGYRLYRGGTLLTTTTGSSYTEEGLLPDTSYTYTLKAYVQSAESGAASATGKTEWAIYYEGPDVTDAAFTVNPAAVNGSTLLRVFVAETAKVLPPTFRYSGELIAGEQ